MSNPTLLERFAVNSHCLPFRQIPHSTRLFLDYLEFTPDIQRFYRRPTSFLDWAKDESSLVQYPAERRERVATILERQNRALAAPSQTLENIAKFRAGAYALVTGQQVGLFGGPVFSIYKALSAVKLADEARKLGISCVPIFWLATEDHDLEEVSQIRIPTLEGQVERLVSATHAKADVPVGSIAFGTEISEAVSRAANLLGECETSILLAECYRPGETFGTAFAKLFARLFGDLGVILLDGSDPELDEIAAPLYRQAIERAPEINRLLLQRDRELQAAGYHQQVRITNSSSLFFVMREGSRIPVHEVSRGQFLIGEEKRSQERLAEMANSAPQSFSPNVAYFAQAGVVYQDLLGRVTPILPRFSATLIEPKSQALLEKYHLAFADVFHGPEALRERIGAHMLPANLQTCFDQATAVVERSMAAIRESLAQLDKTLVESATHAESKMLYQITNLQSRAARAELRHSEVVGRHAEALSNSLYPDKTLQEREFAGIYFLAKHGRKLLNDLLGTIHPDCVDHQLITL